MCKATAKSGCRLQPSNPSSRPFLSWPHSEGALGLTAAHRCCALPWELRVTVEPKGRQDTHSRYGGLAVHLVNSQEFLQCNLHRQPATEARHLGEETSLRTVICFVRPNSSWTAAQLLPPPFPSWASGPASSAHPLHPLWGGSSSSPVPSLPPTTEENNFGFFVWGFIFGKSF